MIPPYPKQNSFPKMIVVKSTEMQQWTHNRNFAVPSVWKDI